MRWALIESGRVANVVEQSSKPAIPGEWVACGNAGPGWGYAGGTFTAPDTAAPRPSWSDPALSDQYFWLDVGPFFDRFGAKALAITSSTDPQVQGIITLILPRKYVHLKRADLPAMLDLLLSKGLITAGEKATVLTPRTTDYERHIKGLPQPE